MAIAEYCPQCGGDPEIHHSEASEEDDDKARYYVLCAAEAPCGMGVVWDFVEQQAINKWNKLVREINRKRLKEGS